MDPATGLPSEWEVGTGVYTSATHTLTRAVIEFNSDNTNTAHNFSSAPNIMLTILAADMAAFSGLSVGVTSIAGGTNTRVLYDNSGALGEYTNAQLTALIGTFTSSLSGAVGSSGGGTANFLRADGAFAIPPSNLTVAATPIAGGNNLRVLYDNSGTLGEYTNAQLTALIGTFTSSLSGAVGSSGGGTVNFLRADGAFSVPPSNMTVGVTPIASGTNTRVLYDNSGALGEYTNAQLTALIGTFTSSLSGAVGSSGGGTVNFLRADGTFQAAAQLNVADQNMSGGATVTSFMVSTGNYTVDCGSCPLQYITNGGTFTVSAPVNDGSCMLLISNGGGAGAVNFAGFSVGSNTGDMLTTTNGNKFTVSIWRINTISGYRIAAHQ
jgi:hypothetical protein